MHLYKHEEYQYGKVSFFFRTSFGIDYGTTYTYFHQIWQGNKWYRFLNTAYTIHTDEAKNVKVIRCSRATA